MAETKRSKHEVLRSQLDNERSSFIAQWRDLSDFIEPRRSRFFVSDVNKGDRRNLKIINSTASLAARTLRSGMMSGITSPSRPWFKLTTPDPDLAEHQAVKEWLDIVTNRMVSMLLGSNIYNNLPIMYGDLGVFGTAAMSLEEDINKVLRTNSFPIGSYYIAKGYDGKINTFARDFRMTVRQLVNMFGRKDDETGKPKWNMFSQQVRDAWDRGNYETWIDVCNIIQPNDEHIKDYTDSKNAKFLSCYYERSQSKNSGEDGEKYLREKGFDYFPIIAPRWEVTGEDVYATNCPGMLSLGDNKALQVMEKRKAQAIEKMVNPPMIAPTAMMNTKTSILPGDISFSDERDGQKGFRPAHEVNFRVSELAADIQRHETRISKAFFEDLFLMLADSDRRQITATEINERKEEKLLALSPVLEQLNQDALDPIINISFDLMLKQGFIPEAPPELQGVDLKVEYVSIMHEAQKRAGVQGIERFAGFLGQVAQFKPEILDKLNSDELADTYAEMSSMPSSIVVPNDVVAGIRQQRQQAAQAQQQAEMMKQGAGAARELSQADLSSDNALTALLGKKPTEGNE